MLRQTRLVKEYTHDHIHNIETNLKPIHISLLKKNVAILYLHIFCLHLTAYSVHT